MSAILIPGCPKTFHNYPGGDFIRDGVAGIKNIPKHPVLWNLKVRVMLGPDAPSNIIKHP